MQMLRGSTKKVEFLKETQFGEDGGGNARQLIYTERSESEREIHLC